MVVSLWTFQDLLGFSATRGAPALPRATRPPAAARPSHARPTRQPSVFPAKGGAPPPNSASGGRREAPSRGRVPGKQGDPPGKERFPSFLAAFASRGCFFRPHFWVSICMEGLFFLGMVHYAPPGYLFFASPFFFYGQKWICFPRVSPPFYFSSAVNRLAFEPHGLSSFFFLFFFACECLKTHTIFSFSFQ